ncbi:MULTISPECIES: ATP-binding protein [unclassified Actinoplanes]|uniref:sensor histidine kinase n=1 Tax=unclassified Actinoplanes TaxID=2626549 RepID=UPI0003200AFF|nr:MULTISPECIES: HAMP domain-containing sensor histidine kinase [unclassified Actinoplanes]
MLDTECETERETELRTLMVTASHDLRSPLTSVAAHVDTIRTDYASALGEDFARDLAAIERGLHRMTRLTQDLLDYARAEYALDATPVPLGAVLADVVADHPTAAVTVATTLPEVLADAGLLRHVFDNLVGNAVKYARAGQSPRIVVSATPMADGTVLIEVADHGIGIPAAERSCVFDAFHRCANRGDRPGTGLGLAICKRIVERHGGRIGVTTGPGGGSRFWFTLPAAAAERPDRLPQA